MSHVMLNKIPKFTYYFSWLDKPASVSSVTHTEKEIRQFLTNFNPDVNTASVD